MKHALITGVSSGLGRHATEFFLQQGWSVFGTARNSEQTRDLETMFPDRFHTVMLDVTNYAQVDAAAQQVKETLGGQTLDLLVNNAGVAIFGPMMYIPISEVEEQMQVNVFGLVKVTQAFLPLMGARTDFQGRPGKIVNIGSVSGIFATPLLGPYCASKFALEAISDCMRRELEVFGVGVHLLQPASVHSRIWSKAENAETHTEGTVYSDFGRQRDRILARSRRTALDPIRVTKVIWEIAIGRKRRARYLITRANFGYRLFAAMPDWLADRMYRRGMRKLTAAAGATS